MIRTVDISRRMVSFYESGRRSRYAAFSTWVAAIPKVCRGDTDFKPNWLGRKLAETTRQVVRQTADYRSRKAADSMLPKGEHKIADRHTSELKSMAFPAVTLSGDWRAWEGGFRIERSANMDPGSWSGLVGFDLDHLDDPESVKQRLARHPACAMAGISASGTGVWFAVVMNRAPVDWSEFAPLWADVLGICQAMFGVRITVDRSCKDGCRLRFLAHDPEFYWNPTPRLIMVRPRDEAVAEISREIEAREKKLASQSARYMEKFMSARRGDARA